MDTAQYRPTSFTPAFSNDLKMHPFKNKIPARIAREGISLLDGNLSLYAV